MYVPRSRHSPALSCESTSTTHKDGAVRALLSPSDMMAAAKAANNIITVCA